MSRLLREPRRDVAVSRQNVDAVSAKLERRYPRTVDLMSLAGIALDLPNDSSRVERGRAENDQTDTCCIMIPELSFG